MRKINLLSMLSAVGIVVSMVFVSSCTKEGAQGPKGENGINGKDGNATCGVCHDNSELVETRILQWGVSKHAIGGTFFENGTSCAPCHTSQGFKEVVLTGAQTTAEVIQNPSNINCYTCHKIHDTYTTDDLQLRYSAPITFWFNGETHDFGKANLCAHCHQSRPQATFPDVTNPQGTFTVTSTRFGPHHGPQSEELVGTGVYLVGEGYINSSHITVPDACITCHKSEAAGNTSGGHTFKIYDTEQGTYNVTGCVACHTEEEAIANIETFQPEIQALLDQLEPLLITAGIYDPATGLAVKGDYTNNVAGAYFNYAFIKEDKSLGVHNPKFAQKLLENSIASFAN
jgi:hypothetical protein